MRATVFTDKSLAGQAGRFVWLSIDTENEKNAKFLEAYPWEAVPTFQVLDPATGRVSYQWLGAVNREQLLERFDEAERAFKGTTGSDADVRYTRAGQLDAQGKAAEAATAYEEALRSGGDAWPSRGRAVEAMVYALMQSDQTEACATRALEFLPKLPPGPSRANVAALGLDCALGADEKAAWRAPAVATFEPAVRESLAYDGLSSDDKAALHAVLVDARDRQKDEAGAKAAAVALLEFLEADAKTAPSAEARAALDGFRVSAAIAAGDPARAIEPLSASERELPRDYNPPARLAIVYRELERYDEALAASSRALQKVYGPRKLTVLDARATIFERQGDTDQAKATLEQAIAFAGTLPEPQRPKRMLARLEKRLTEMSQTP